MSIIVEFLFQAQEKMVGHHWALGQSGRGACIIQPWIACPRHICTWHDLLAVRLSYRLSFPER